MKQHIARYRKEFQCFWKYALLTKCRIARYNSKKIILLRLDLIGDCTMFTSAALALHEHYKGREMTIVCLSISRPIFERLGIFSKIITVDFRPESIIWNKMRGLLAEIRNDTYDILLQPQLSKFPIADIVAAATKCNCRISIEPISPHGNSSPAWIKMTNFLYDKFIPYPRGIVSEFAYYGAFVRGICGPSYKTQMPKLSYGEQHFIKSDYYVLYPAGSLRQKFWPADRYAKIAEYIYKVTGLTGVILGSTSEQWVADDVKLNLNTIVGTSIVDLTGRTSIFDVIDIIGNAKLVVTNDTSGVHIAAATNTPSVAIAGGWHYKRFLPYGIEDVNPEDRIPLVAYTQMPCYNCTWSWEVVEAKNPTCLKLLKSGKLSPCIEAVRVEQVIELIDQIIVEEKLS